MLVYNINISIKVMKYVHKIPTKSMIILRIIQYIFSLYFKVNGQRWPGTFGTEWG